MAVKQGEPGVVGYKIDINPAEAFSEDGVFENSGGFSSMNFGDLEIMPMQMQRVRVVTFVDESEPITATLLNLDRLALIVRLTVDRPDVESALATVDFPNFHRDHLLGQSRWL